MDLICLVVNISSTLNSYKDYDYSFEESLVLAKNSVEINARFDAISISENHATLLEIKTDKQQSTETLLKKYKTISYKRTIQRI